jgi:hypothetical protein
MVSQLQERWVGFRILFWLSFELPERHGEEHGCLETWVFSKASLWLDLTCVFPHMFQRSCWELGENQVIGGWEVLCMMRMMMTTFVSCKNCRILSDRQRRACSDRKENSWGGDDVMYVKVVLYRDSAGDTSSILLCSDGYREWSSVDRLQPLHWVSSNKHSWGTYLQINHQPDQLWCLLTREMTNRDMGFLQGSEFCCDLYVLGNNLFADPNLELQSKFIFY